MKLFFFLLIFLPHSLLAQPIEGEGDAPKKYLMITSFKNEAMTAFQLEQIDKIMLKVATKQVEYSLALGEGKDYEGVKSTLVSMQLQVEKKPLGFYVKALLLDIKNKRVIKIVDKDMVKEDNLLYRIQKCLEHLFIDIAKEAPIRETKKKSLTNQQEEKRTLDNQKNLDSFRERIKGIKAGIASTIKDIKPVQPRIDTPEIVKDQKDNKVDSKEDNNASSSEMLAKQDEAEFLDPPPKGKPSPPFAIANAVKLTYRQQNTHSEDIVLSDATFKYMCLNYQRGLFFDVSKNNQLLLGIAYGKLINTFTAKIGDYTDVSLDYRYIFNSVGFSPGIGIEREGIAFINLPAAGGGLKGANNTLTMARVRLDYEFEIFTKTFIAGIQYGQNLMTQTDYATLSNSSGLTGKKIQARLQWNNIWKIIHVEAEYFNFNLTSSGGTRPVIVTSSGYGFNALFTF
jgi:hypothetical protein